MRTEIMRLKIMKRYNLFRETRFKCSPYDFRELVKERKVNPFGQLLSNITISLRPESDVAVGNIVSDNVTLN